LEVNLILAQIPVYYRFPKDGEHLPKHVAAIYMYVYRPLVIIYIL